MVIVKGLNMNKVNWCDKEGLIAIVNKSKNLSEVLTYLGLSVKSSGSYGTLKKYIETYSIDISHFHNGIIMNWDDVQKLKNAISTSTNKSETLRQLGLNERSGNFTTLQKYIKKYNIDISHFNPYRRGQSVNTVKMTDAEWFVNGIRRNGQYTRNRLVESGHIDDKCSKCGLGNEWNNETLVLQLEHTDGDSLNNEILNLTLLCPNCHSQTKTYAGRNNKRRFIPVQ